MVSVLLAPGGHKKVMQAFDYFRAITKERTRFQLLVTSLTQEPVEPAYQVGPTVGPYSIAVILVLGILQVYMSLGHFIDEIRVH